MVRVSTMSAGPRFLWLAAACSIVVPGCSVVPRSQVAECQQVSQTLRAENARLKDRVLALQSQNRDYADRAVDDLRRLAAQDQAIDRLERSVEAYQSEREKLAEAYAQVTAGLGQSGRAARDSTERAAIRPPQSDRPAAGRPRTSSLGATSGRDEPAPP
jgi:hypothetical protein